MPKDHLVWLRVVFQKLKEEGLKLRPSKCEFLKRSIKTDDSKIKMIQEWPTPKPSQRLEVS